MPTLRALGISLVPWSPLGSGFLTGHFDQLAENDFRRNYPRYSTDNLNANRDRFAPLMKIARAQGVTPAQLALAWLLHQGPEIVPIPGTRRRERIDENARAATIVLNSALLDEIDKLARPGLASGATLL